MVEYRVNTEKFQKSISAFKEIYGNASTAMRLIAMKIDQFTQQTFQNEGARKDHQAWQPFKGSTLRYPNGKWRHRYGTDGANGRFYSSSSKLLQASGGFRKSFNILETGPKSFKFGTFRTLQGSRGPIQTKDIIRDRDVIFLTRDDYREIHGLFKTWTSQEMQRKIKGA